MYGKQMPGQNVKGKRLSICGNAVPQHAKTMRVVMLLILIIEGGAKERRDHAAPGQREGMSGQEVRRRTKIMIGIMMACEVVALLTSIDMCPVRAIALPDEKNKGIVCETIAVTGNTMTGGIGTGTNVRPRNGDIRILINFVMMAMANVTNVGQRDMTTVETVFGMENPTVVTMELLIQSIELIPPGSSGWTIGLIIVTAIAKVELIMIVENRLVIATEVGPGVRKGTEIGKEKETEIEIEKAIVTARGTTKRKTSTERETEKGKSVENWIENMIAKDTRSGAILVWNATYLQMIEAMGETAGDTFRGIDPKQDVRYVRSENTLVLLKYHIGCDVVKSSQVPQPEQHQEADFASIHVLILCP